MINVTLSFADVSELLTFFQSIQAPASGVKVELATAEVLAAKEAAPSPKPVKPAKPAPAAATAPSQPTVEAAPSPAPAAPAPATSAPAAAAPTAAPAAAPSAPAEMTYAELSKAVLALHKMDPTAAVPIAKSLGADTFKLLQPQQWAEAHRLVTEAIAARS